MALRRSGQRFTANIWPGFVDAMTALLLVLMFVLTIFMIVQFVLRETITGQDEELNALGLEISSLAQALGLEQQRSANLEDNVDTLDASLSDAQNRANQQASLIASLNAQSETQQAKIADFETQVASLLAKNTDLAGTLAQTQNQVVILQGQANDLDAQLADSRTTAEGLEADRQQLLADKTALEAVNLREISQKEALELALAQARDEIDVQVQDARLAASKTEALEALIANLRNNISDNAASLETALADLLQARNDLGETRTALANTQAEQSDTDAARAALEAERDRLTEDVQVARTRLDETNRTADALEVERDSLQAQLGETTLTAKALEARIAELLQGITDEEKAKLAEAAAAEALRARLQDADAELTAMSLALDAKRQEAEDTLTLLAAARAANSELQSSVQRELSEKEKRDALLAAANQTLAQEQAVSAESLRKLEVLNQQSADLRTQLNVLQGLLDAAKDRDTDAQIQIEALGSNLNVALAQAAVEQRKRAELEEAERKRLEAETKDLEKFKSEFFANIRGLLEGREGVQLVGDRFVFSSEVLFTAGSADLGSGGQREVAKVASLIREIADKIPEDIDWILRVDGHTDNVPLSGEGEYKNNWELSQARSLSVVRYLNEFLGIPAKRLAANGFGEYQPIATGNSAQARATNRRIELKFTEK